MAGPEPYRSRRQLQPLQVQSPSVQNVVFQDRRHRPSLYKPLPYSASLQPVYKHPPETGCSRSNSLAVRSSSSRRHRRAQPPLPYSQRRDGTAVSSVQFAPAPANMPLLPTSRPPAKRKSYPDLFNMVSQTVEMADELAWELEQQVRDCTACGEDAVETMSNRFGEVITLIDEGMLNGERNLVFSDPFDAYYGAGQTARKIGRKASKYKHTAAEYFSKVYSYCNSRLPSQLPPLKLSRYTPTYTLLRLAAQYSAQVYEKPVGTERQCYINSDWIQGTKAMVVKSIPLDNLNTIVFAIRGTQTFHDWAINLKNEPASPADFLDDPDNLCHAGFLSVARKTVAPIAARLRSLLAEDSNRIAHSLVITGHSAGGAIASLLFCHMVSKYVRSELAHLRRFFKRVHCVTFGAPPVSLRPLQLPRWNSVSPNKSMFFAFVNEGDPVPRAEKSYILSLLDLYTSPTSKSRKPIKWKLPKSTLSSAGKLVVLREQPAYSRSSRDKVEACVITEKQLRKVVFGDPLMHMMDLYMERIEELARKAVCYLPCVV